MQRVTREQLDSLVELINQENKRYIVSIGKAYGGYKIEYYKTEKPSELVMESNYRMTARETYFCLNEIIRYVVTMER